MFFFSFMIWNITPRCLNKLHLSASVIFVILFKKSFTSFVFSYLFCKIRDWLRSSPSFLLAEHFLQMGRHQSDGENGICLGLVLFLLHLSLTLWYFHWLTWDPLLISPDLRGSRTSHWNCVEILMQHGRRKRTIDYTLPWGMCWSLKDCLFVLRLGTTHWTLWDHFLICKMDIGMNVLSVCSTG
jgi:hypothetical protein